MLETRARVVKTEGLHALVRADQSNGCNQCNGKGCGAGKLSQLFCSRPREFQVKNVINASVGDEVIVSVEDGAVLRGIGFVYLLPLLLLLFGALLGSTFSQQPEMSDNYAALGAFFGLVTGFFYAKWKVFKQSGSQFQPYISRQFKEDTQPG